MNVDQRILFSEIQAQVLCPPQDLNINFFLFSETLMYFWDLLHHSSVQGHAFEGTHRFTEKKKIPDTVVRLIERNYASYMYMYAGVLGTSLGRIIKHVETITMLFKARQQVWTS